MFTILFIILFFSLALNWYLVFKVVPDDYKHLEMAADIIHAYQNDMQELEKLYAERKAFNVSLLKHIQEEHQVFPAIVPIHMN